MKVFRRATFNSAHRLYREDWNDSQNLEIFGKCSNPNFHGHNYVIEVAVDGPIDPETGYVIDLKILKDIIHSEVADYFDHRNLNLDIKEFANLNPTVENIALVSYNLLKAKLPEHLKLFVRLFETHNNWVEFAGE